MPMRNRLRVSLILLVGLSAIASAETGSEDWQFELTPYLWLPSIEGDLRYESPPGDGGNPIVSIGPTNFLDLLNFGLLVEGSARKGKFSIFSDLIYLSMGKETDGRVISVEGSNPGPGGMIEIPVSPEITLDTRTELDGLLWSIAFGYALQQTGTSFLEVFVGTRYLSVDASTSWNLTAAIMSPQGTVELPAQGGISGSTDIWDAIVGVRGKFTIGESHWSVPYHLDVGAGSSDLTWNAMAGLAYAYGWGELIMVYRHLQYDQGPDGLLLQGFSFSGPAVGVRFFF